MEIDAITIDDRRRRRQAVLRVREFCRLQSKDFDIQYDRPSVAIDGDRSQLGLVGLSESPFDRPHERIHGGHAEARAGVRIERF